jgi:hypothetical protein
MSNMYESGSLGAQFKPHQQGPKPLPKSGLGTTAAFGQATTPAHSVIQERPSYVIVAGQSATAYQFLYETTASLGGLSAGETYTQGLDLQAISNAPIRLDINPVAWKGGGDATGEVTFVYRGGL